MLADSTESLGFSFARVISIFLKCAFILTLELMSPILSLVGEKPFSTCRRGRQVELHCVDWGYSMCSDCI